MSKKNKTTYLWRITTAKDGAGSEIEHTEHFVSAQDIEQVWDHLKLDRADEGVEVISIRREVPILKDLSEK